MAYIDTLQKVSIPVNGKSVECVAGSFKGVPFFFESTGFSGGGRNIQTNSIPFSNDHVNEDTGRNVAKYSFNIYFVGEDAENKKNDFLRVCNEEGAGELVHPYFGVFQVRQTGEINLTYNNQQEFISGSVSFVPENDFELKNSVVSLSAKTKQKAKELRRSVADKASKPFKTSGKKLSVLQKAVAMSQKAVDAVYSCRKVIQKASEFAREVGRVKANIQAIMLSPQDFIARVQNLISMSAEIVGFDIDPKDNVKNGIALMTFNLDDVDVFDSQSAENRSALVSLMRMSGASMVAENLVDCEFSSTSEAENFENDVYDAFENMLADIDDVDLYAKAQELEAASLKYLRDSLSKIPYEVAIERKQTNNLLTLVYEVFGGIDKLDSVVERNDFKNPLLVTPGEKMVVLCD